MPYALTDRSDALGMLAHGALAGRLGLFVGAGMSKALTAGLPAAAPSWQELLSNVAGKLGLAVDYAAIIAQPGVSLPRVASELCQRHADRRPCDYGTAVHEFRSLVAGASFLEPSIAIGQRYGRLLTEIRPAWIVTTNYDFCLEKILSNARTFLPHQRVSSVASVLPIYHLHGHCLDPGSIVITEEDYVSLFRPGTYRQQKLALLLSEGVTAMLGYGLGDINVLVALDLAAQFGEDPIDPAQGLVVQALRDVGNTSGPPRKGRRGEVLLPIGDIGDFLEELATERRRVETVWTTTRAAIDALLSSLPSPLDLIVDPGRRRLLVNALVGSPFLLDLQRVMETLGGGFAAANERAHDGMSGWPFYAHMINAVLDFLEAWPLARIPPPLFESLASALALVAPLIGLTPGVHTRGDAYDASDRWHARKARLPEDVKRSLAHYAESRNHVRMKELMKF